MDNSQMHEFLGNFWNWMHLHWTYASMSDCCCTSEMVTFKECVDKFIAEIELNKFHELVMRLENER